MSDTRTAPGDSTMATPPAATRGLFWIYPEERFCALKPGTTLIGRGEDAAIRITGGQVSRRHATLTVTETRITLRDEGSLNKARCNLSPLPECQLSDNDVVRVGDWVGVVTEGLLFDEPNAPLFRENEDGVLVGPRSQRMWRTLEQVASQPIPLVIEGETGTGKEVLARAIHRFSGRAGPFVAVNCAAQPEGLFEALFFGHTKGAFTGAAQATTGFFAAADGGTLFLDELVELSATQQAKVLRVLEDRQVTPVGSTQSRPIDVRVVSAAQRPLGLAADEGRFRADLYARLNGLTLKLLPLRARREEIPRLFSRVLASSGEVPRLSAGFIEGLCVHPWSLNVRELVTVAARVRALFPGETELTKRHLMEVLTSDTAQMAPVSVASEPPARGPSPLGARTAAWLERHRHLLPALTHALKESRGNLSHAARQIGISRQQAQRLLDAAALEARGRPPEGVS